MIRNFLSLTILLWACGPAPSAKVTQPPNHNEYAVSSMSDLPVCDSAHADWLYYVEADTSFRVCQSGSWITINLTGPKGDAGPAGEQGRSGTSTGATAIASSIFCQGALSETAYNFTYTVDIFSSGDVYATAGVTGDEAQYGASDFYAAAQNGAATATVLFTYDVATPADNGFWTLSLDRTTLVTSIAYTDVDLTGGGLTWTMTPDKCTSHTY